MKTRDVLTSDTIAFVPEADGVRWKTTVPIEFEDVIVPVGTITDFASVPRIFWAIFPPFGRYMKAAVLHDYLYQTHRTSRRQADKLFLRAMKALGVSKITRTILFQAVRWFGNASYQSNHPEQEARQ